jgi:hypothetical protein
MNYTEQQIEPVTQDRAAIVEQRARKICQRRGVNPDEVTDDYGPVLQWHQEAYHINEAIEALLPDCTTPAPITTEQSSEIAAMREALENIMALASKRQAEGGPDGNLAAIEGFARAALTQGKTQSDAMCNAVIEECAKAARATLAREIATAIRALTQGKPE